MAATEPADQLDHEPIGEALDKVVEVFLALHVGLDAFSWCWVCRGCGKTWLPDTPCRARVMLAGGRDFAEQHRQCGAAAGPDASAVAPDGPVGRAVNLIDRLWFAQREKYTGPAAAVEAGWNELRRLLEEPVVRPDRIWDVYRLCRGYAHELYAEAGTIPEEWDPLCAELERHTGGPDPNECDASRLARELEIVEVQAAIRLLLRCCDADGRVFVGRARTVWSRFDTAHRLELERAGRAPLDCRWRELWRAIADQAGSVAGPQGLWFAVVAGCAGGLQPLLTETAAAIWRAIGCWTYADPKSEPRLRSDVNRTITAALNEATTTKKEPRDAL